MFSVVAKDGSSLSMSTVSVSKRTVTSLPAALSTIAFLRLSWLDDPVSFSMYSSEVLSVSPCTSSLNVITILSASRSNVKESTNGGTRSALCRVTLKLMTLPIELLAVSLMLEGKTVKNVELLSLASPGVCLICVKTL